MHKSGLVRKDQSIRRLLRHWMGSICLVRIWPVGGRHNMLPMRKSVMPVVKGLNLSLIDTARVSRLDGARFERCVSPDCNPLYNAKITSSAPSTVCPHMHFTSRTCGTYFWYHLEYPHVALPIL
jgi:hypothetical protein